MALVSSPALLHLPPHSLALQSSPFFKGKATHQACRCSNSRNIGGRSRRRSTHEDEIEVLAFPTASCSYFHIPDESRGRERDGIIGSDGNKRFSLLRKLFAELRLGVEGGDSGASRRNVSGGTLGRRFLLSLLTFGLPLPQLAHPFRDSNAATAAVLEADTPPSVSLDDNSSETDDTEGQVIEDGFGFDGLGKASGEYVLGKVVALAQAGDGAVVFLGVDGFDVPLQLLVGPAEAMAVLTAVQERKSRRPVTHEAWGLSLAAVGWKVDRVLITANEKDIFYSNLVLSNRSQLLLSTSDATKSVDMRPSDGIALALRCRAPLFVRRKVVEDILSAKMDSECRVQVDPLKQPGLQANNNDASLITFVQNSICSVSGRGLGQVS